MIDLGIAVLSFILAVTVHEVGHAVACGTLDFSVQAFSVWPLTIYRGQESWKVCWGRRPSRQLVALGFVSAYPRTMRRVRIRTVGMLLAGPFASAIAFAMCATARDTFAGSAHLSNMLGEVASWSLLFAIVNLIPTSRCGGSDGRKAWDVLRGKSAVLRAAAIWTLLNATNALRPREWDPALVSLAVAAESGDLLRPVDLSAPLQWLKYNWYADTGRRSEAAQAIQWLVSEQESEFGRWLARWEAAWFEAFSNNNPAAAHQHIEVAERMTPQKLGQHAKWKAQCAVAAREGHMEEAMGYAGKAKLALASESASIWMKLAVEGNLAVVLSECG